MKKVAVGLILSLSLLSVGLAAPPANNNNCAGVDAALLASAGAGFGQAVAGFAQQQLTDDILLTLANCGNNRGQNP